jgi:hypothetical protein
MRVVCCGFVGGFAFDLLVGLRRGVQWMLTEMPSLLAVSILLKISSNPLCWHRQRSG